jgi:hypothetical protein
MADKLSLSDIKPLTITVNVVQAEIGFQKDIDICLPTLQEWQDVYMTVDFPSAPVRQRMVNNKKEDYTDVNDSEYLRAKEQALDALAMRRATHAMLKAGNFPELKKLPIQEATERLIQEADRSILLAVYQLMMRLMTGMRGGVEAKKATFQGNSLHASGNADSDTTSEGLEMVESA